MIIENNTCSNMQETIEKAKDYIRQKKIVETKRDPTLVIIDKMLERKGIIVVSRKKNSRHSI